MRILLALIYVQNSITMPNLAVIQLMRVIKWTRSDSDGSYVKINVRGNKGFYSTLMWLRKNKIYSPSAGGHVKVILLFASAP